MTERGRAIVFNVDEATLESLRQAFSEWQVEVSDRFTIDLLIGGRSLGVVDLLVLGVDANVAESLGLCRILQQPGSAHPPIPMLVLPGEDSERRWRRGPRLAWSCRPTLKSWRAW